MPHPLRLHEMFRFRWIGYRPWVRYTFGRWSDLAGVQGWLGSAELSP